MKRSFSVNLLSKELYCTESSIEILTMALIVHTDLMCEDSVMIILTIRCVMSVVERLMMDWEQCAMIACRIVNGLVRHTMLLDRGR